jgi:digeranylgeranylglycerophospholipid reductase
MGALSCVAEPASQLPPVRERYDVVVVGAGPAGSIAAREAAAHGMSVLLLEKRQEIGSPVRCAEGIGHAALSRFLEPDESWISSHIRRARIVLVNEGRECEWQAEAVSEGQVGYVLERRVFDRVLAERAAEAGARVLVKSTVTGLIREGPAVSGVVVEGAWGRREVAARVVIGADGVESRVGTWAGLDTTLPAQDQMACAQLLLAGIDIDPECTLYYLDPELAPGGYLWVFPKGEDRANVGLGVQAGLGTAPPVELLKRFAESRPFLSQGSPVTVIAGGVPVGPAPQRIVTDGCMLVGDAARQVDPLTGGGIGNAMLAGSLAGGVAADAIAAGDVSQAVLTRYEEQWAVEAGRQMVRNYRLRARFPVEERTSERFVRIFAMAVAAGK